MISANATPRAVTSKASSLELGRPALIALWAVQVALAAMFLLAGGSKLAGVPAMVTMFDTIGLGQWFRYATGIVEVVAGIALLVPAAAVYGALLLIPTMVGAAIANVAVLHQSPAIPVVLLAGASGVLWLRRRQLRRP
jgi:putative oxidoreductase